MQIIETIELQDSTAGAARRLYKLENGTHVVTSALPMAFDTGSPETYVFLADENGEVLEWEELPGSFRGDIDHDRAIQGYLASLA